MSGALGDFAYPIRSGVFDEGCDCRFFWFPQIHGLFQTVGATKYKQTGFPEYTSPSTPAKYYLRRYTSWRYYGDAGGGVFATYFEETVIDADDGSTTVTESATPFPGYPEFGSTTPVVTTNKTTVSTVWTRYEVDGTTVLSRLVQQDTISEEHTTEMIINGVLDDIDDFPLDFPGTIHTGGSLTAGHNYVLLELGVGGDFTGVGCAANEIGVIFSATGTSPAWGSGSVLAEYPWSTGPAFYLSGSGAVSHGWAVSSGICYSPGSAVWDSTGTFPAAWRWLKTNERAFTLVRMRYCLALPKLAGPGSCTVEWDEQFFPPTSSSDPDIPGQPDWDNPGTAEGQSFAGDETTRQTDAQVVPDPVDNGYVFVQNARYTALG